MKALLLILLVACAKPAGGPLAHTFDNTKIAAVPLDQKSAVVQAQQAYELAQLHQKTVAQTYASSEIEEDAAKLQADRTIVTSQVVAARQPDAKVAAATGDAATLARKTADAKVDFMIARRDWLSKASDAALYTVYATQARLELERAKVALAAHLAAADFTVDPYQKQADAREAAAKTATDAAEALRKTAETRLVAWAELEKSYLSSTGVTGPLESGHFASEWKPVEPPPAPPAPPPVAEPPTHPEPPTTVAPVPST